MQIGGYLLNNEKKNFSFIQRSLCMLGSFSSSIQILYNIFSRICIERYLVYKLRRVKGGFYLVGLENSEMPSTPKSE